MSHNDQEPARDDVYGDPDVQKAIDDFDARMDSSKATFERPSFLEFLGLTRKRSDREPEIDKNTMRN